MGMLRRIFWDQIGGGLCPNRYCIIDEGEIFGTCKGAFDTVSGLFCRLDGIVDGNTLGDAKGRWVNGRGWITTELLMLLVWWCGVVDVDVGHR